MENGDIQRLLTLISTKREGAQSLLDALYKRDPGMVRAFLTTQPYPGESVNPFKRGIRKASEFSDTVPSLIRLWFGFYPGALIYLCGETGAGKSSLLYNILIHAARNEPLWRILFGAKRPLKGLYIDPENSGDFDSDIPGLCEQKLSRIAQGKPDMLHFHDGQGVNLSQPEQVDALERLILQEQYDIVILDPIINLYSTKDENDNAEAGRQFTELKSLAKRTGCCIVAVHHTGHDNTSNFGRGASARLGAADVGLMLRRKGEGTEADDDYEAEEVVKPRIDCVRLEMVKNRLEPIKNSLYLRMVGNDRFERISYAEWRNHAKPEKETNEPSPAKLDVAKKAVLLLLEDNLPHKTEVIIQQLKSQGIGRNSVNDALRELRENKIKEIRQGREVFYQIIVTDGLSPKENDHHQQSFLPFPMQEFNPCSESSEERNEPDEESQAAGILAVDEESDKCQRIDPSGFDKD